MSTPRGVIGAALPQCPSGVGWLSAPSSSLCSAVVAVCYWAAAAYVYARLSHVVVMRRSVSAPPVSNNLWSLFFAVRGLREAIEFVRFGFVSLMSTTADASFMLAAELLGGVVVLCLSLAINHRRKYRYTKAMTLEADNVSVAGSETDALLDKYEWANQITRGYEFVFYLLLCAYFAVLYVEVVNPTTGTNELLIAGIVCQQAPVYILACMIVFQTRVDGPWRSAKVYLAAATCLSVGNLFPVTIWAGLLGVGSECALGFASWVDVIYVLGALSLVPYVLFLRAEYTRKKDETVFRALSKFQDSFDVRTI